MIKDLILNSKDKLLIYVHIPFCKTKCHYCYYRSVVNHNGAYQREYIRKIIWELEYYKEVFEKRRNDIVSIYIGGGSPSELTKENLRLLLSAIHNIINIPSLSNLDQFTIELNPSIVEHKDCEKKISLMQKYGINRISYGVQSFDDEVLRRNNCSHRVHHIYRAINLAEQYKFPYNLDLIFGLLGASFDSGIRSVLAALDILPPQIEINSPMFYPRDYFKAIKNMREKPLTYLQQILLIQITYILFLKLRYGCSNYRYYRYSRDIHELSLKKEDISVYDQLQWGGSADVIGIGCSARSNNLKQNIISENICDVNKYIMNDSHLKFEKIHYNYLKLLDKEGVVKTFFKGRLIFPDFKGNYKNKTFKLNNSDNLYVAYLLSGIEMEVYHNALVSQYFYERAIELYPQNPLAYFCIIDLLIRNRKYNTVDYYIHRFPEARNSNRLLSVLFLIIEASRFTNNNPLGNIKKTVKKILLKQKVDLGNLDLKEYHYHKMQLPEDFLRYFLRLYNSLSKTVNANLGFRELL